MMMMKYNVIKFKKLIIIILVFFSIFILNVGILSKKNICEFKNEIISFLFMRLVLLIILFAIISFYIFLINIMEKKININISILKNKSLLIIIFIFLLFGLLVNLFNVLNYNC